MRCGRLLTTVVVLFAAAGCASLNSAYDSAMTAIGLGDAAAPAASPASSSNARFEAGALGASGMVEAGARCSGGPLRKVLLTALPLAWPEQLRPNEYSAWAQAASQRLAQVLQRHGRLRVAPAPELFAFATAATAPKLARDAAGAALISRRAAANKAQYVIAGVFTDFGLSSQALLFSQRRMALEMFVFTVDEPRLLARREFVASLSFAGALPRSLRVDSDEFAASRFGAAWLGLLDEAAVWLENAIACQPFSSRVTAVNGLRLTLDAGADSGVAVGAALAAGPAGGDADEEALATISEVHDEYSFADIPRQWRPPQITPGDVLYIIEQ